MKIALRMLEHEAEPAKAAQQESLERDIIGTVKGDWRARNNLVRTFLPLIHSLVEKRAGSPAQAEACVEAAKKGLLEAARKYRHSMGPEKFQLLALDHIHRNLDRAVGGRGLFSWLFRRRS
jgi:DNA-directed RNA polymerase specialized sigma subunit